MYWLILASSEVEVVVAWPQKLPAFQYASDRLHKLSGCRRNHLSRPQTELFELRNNKVKLQISPDVFPSPESRHRSYAGFRREASKMSLTLDVDVHMLDVDVDVKR